MLEEMKPREKQLELIEMLKSLNLDEAQICNSSSMNVQEVLIELMRNWETLSKK